MIVALTLILTLAFLGALVYCLLSESRRDRIEAEAWNSTRPKHDWPTR